MLRKELRKNSLIVEEELELLVKQMLEIEELLIKFKNDEYYYILLDEFKEKHNLKGMPHYNIVNGEFIKNRTCFDGFPEEKRKELEAEYDNLIWESDALRKKDLKKALKLIEENMCGWWD